MIKHLQSKQFDGPFRHQRLLHHLKQVLTPNNSVLYVGARPERIDHVNIFENMPVTVLEIWHKNVAMIDKMIINHVQRTKAVQNLLLAKYVNMITGDICDPNILKDLKFNISMWWHGPEHVEMNRLAGAVKNLEDHTTTVVVLGCPWGKYEQEFGSNSYETHRSHIQPEFFADLGYEVEVQGVEGPGSNIMAIKWL